MMKKDSADGTPNTSTSLATNTRPLMTLYEKIYFTRDDSLTEALVNAICDGHEIPQELDIALTTYQKIYLSPVSLEAAKVTQRDNIKSLCTNSNTQKFKQLLATRQPINPGLINSIRSALKLEVEETLLIEGRIIDGKVYYITISPWSGEIINTGHKSKKSAVFTYDPSTCFRMTPDQFLEFKQAGKRTGNYEIQESEFVEVISKAIDGIGSIKSHALWAELKDNGILDAHNRLSSNWHNLLGAKIILKHCDTDIPELNRVLSIFAAAGSRKSRTPIVWKNDGFTFGARTEESKTLDWDVSTLAELEHFSPTTDKFTFVHLPDQKTLASYRFSNNETISETPKQWMALAVPTDRVKDLESKPSTIDDLLSLATSPKEVGAVRDLYRSSFKNYPPTAGHSPIGKTPHLFWNNAPKDRKEADQKIAACLNSFAHRP
jgi:hypothetical protein